MAERIKSNGKCPITGNVCMCDCSTAPDEMCFIDVNTDGVVRKMSQAAYDGSLDAVGKSQLDNVPIEFKLKIAEMINQHAKRRIGKRNRNS